MEPASIVSLIAFATSASNAIASGIKAIQQAPAEILSLHNEVNDLKLVLVQYSFVQGQLRERPNSPAFDDVLDKCLKVIERHFDQLAVLSETLFNQLPNGKSRFERHTWLRKKSSVVRLQLDLSVARRNLHDLIGIATASSVTRIEVQLGSLTDVLHAARLVSGDSSSTHQLPSDQTAGGSESIVSRSQSYASAKSTPVVLSTYTRPACDLTCSCTCHARRGLRSSAFTTSVLGALFVGYTGLPTLNATCETGTCAYSSVRAVCIRYVFPSWFVQRTLQFIIGFNYFGEPEINIKLRNRVEFTSENSMFQLARRGKVNQMRQLLDERRASPNDISLRGGHTAFDWALQHARGTGDFRAAELLLQAGVDLHATDDAGSSSAMVAFGQLLGPLRDQFAQGLTPLLRNLDPSELFDFSHVHKVVLGILPLNLRTEIEKLSHRSHIDTADALRRTPLHWAAHRADIEAVRTLLLAGANQHLKDAEGRTSFLTAVMSGNLTCIELLLFNGANVHETDAVGDNAMLTAAWAADSPEIITKLASANARVMSRNSNGVTPLQSACCLNHYDNVHKLIDLAADVDACDHNGDSPIFETIYYGCTESMELLLRQNLDYMHCNSKGWTLLHVLALYGTTDILDRLSCVAKYMEPQAQDVKGRTPLETLEDRLEIEDNFRSSFEQFLQQSRSAADDSDSVDSWASAAEA